MNRNHFKIEKPYRYFLLIWLVFNLIQAAFTYLHFDEAYYYIFSRDLAWGYFDHPPVVAFLCYLGYSIFQNELGLRLFHVLLSTGTIYFIILLIKEKYAFKSVLVVLLSFPIVFFHIAGFLAIPDTALMFFATLFWLCYRSFVDKPTLQLSLLMGLVGGLMILSKYHGGVLLFFIFISNWKLIYNKYAWLAVAIILVIVSPHIFWQYANGFPSLSYHFVERASGFDIENVLNYVGSQIVVIGPFTGVMVIYAIFKTRVKGVFERAHFMTIIGFWALFLVLSFRDHMEAHWTAIAMPSMMYFVMPFMEKDKYRTWFTKLAIPAIIIVVLARLYLLKVFPEYGETKKIMRNCDQEVEIIQQHSQGLPVIVGGSHKSAALYTFYTKSEVTNLPYYFKRYTYYDNKHFDDKYIGQKVFIITGKEKEKNMMQYNDARSAYYFIEDNFVSYRNIEILNAQINYENDSTISIGATIQNNSSYVLDYNASKKLEPLFIVTTTDNKINRLEVKPFTSVLMQNKIEPDEIQEFKFEMKKPEAGNYLLQVRFNRFRGDEYVFQVK